MFHLINACRMYKGKKSGRPNRLRRWHGAVNETFANLNVAGDAGIIDGEASTWQSDLGVNRGLSPQHVSQSTQCNGSTAISYRMRERCRMS